MKIIKFEIIENREEFLNLNEERKTDEYFKIVEQIKKLSKPKKNSKNSSQSPYTDITRKHKSSKEKGKMGPPKGHKGISRKLSENPDHILFVPITKDPDTKEQVNSNSNSYQTHQILEIEPIKFIIIEIQRQTTTVNGRTVTAPNPEGIGDYDRIGANLKSYVSSLRYSLDVPWNRILKWFKETAKDTIGAGTINSILKELKEKSALEYEQIKEDIRESSVVGADETSYHVNGKKWWMHVYRTEDATCFVADKSRAHDVPVKILGDDFSGILLTDFWGAYNPGFYGENTDFAKCMAHALRHIIYAIECEEGKGEYAKKMKDVIIDAIILKKEINFESNKYKKQRQELENKLGALLADDVDTITNEGKKIWKLFRKYREHIFKFLYIKELPPDNNGSERDIREIVRSRKISKAYKTEKGLKDLAQIKSIVLTKRKRNENVFSFFQNVFGELILNTE